MGGSLLLLFAVRAARQLAMIHLPVPADASHPTTYPWDHSPSAQEVSGEVAPGRRQALRLAPTRSGWQQSSGWATVMMQVIMRG